MTPRENRAADGNYAILYAGEKRAANLPNAKNDTPHGQAQNRRVVIKRTS